MLPAHARLATLAPMSKGTTEIASGAARDIEPELRELFTKVVERDPHEAVKMLEPYPDEFADVLKACSVYSKRSDPWDDL